MTFGSSQMRACIKLDEAFGMMMLPRLTVTLHTRPLASVLRLSPVGLNMAAEDYPSRTQDFLNQGGDSNALLLAWHHHSRLFGTLNPHRPLLPCTACAARSFFSLLAGSSMGFSLLSLTIACKGILADDTPRIGLRTVLP